MKIYCVFSLESPHRDDSNVYTQYTFFIVKKKLAQVILNLQLWIGCFGFNGPLRQYFSLYRAVSQREGERGERIDESENVQTVPTRTYCKRNRPLPYCYQNCRTPRHWKFTQHHRTTRPPHAMGFFPRDSRMSSKQQW